MAVGAGRIELLRARIEAARLRCKELMGDTEFAAAHSSLQVSKSSPIFVN